MNYVALRMLFGDRAKYLMLLCGLTFAVMLIVQQGSIFLGAHDLVPIEYQ